MKKYGIVLSLGLILGAFFQMGFYWQDGRAQKVLNDFESRFESVKDLSGNFTYGISNPSMSKETMRQGVQKSGNFKLKRSNKYVIDLEDQQIYCNGDKIWIYLKDDAEVVITDYEPDEGMNIEEIFSLYKTNASSRYDGVEKVHGVNCDKVYLVFKDNSLDYNQAMLWIGQKSKLLEKAVTIDRRQTKTTYEFSNVKSNNGFGDNVFQFDVAAHPDVDVYDETE